MLKGFAEAELDEDNAKREKGSVTDLGRLKFRGGVARGRYRSRFPERRRPEHAQDAWVNCEHGFVLALALLSEETFRSSLPLQSDLSHGVPHR